MSSDSPAPPRTGLSLYANLLDNKTNSTISRAPVSFAQNSQQDDAASKKPMNAAALRFQPQIKRPQNQANKAKPKPSLKKLPSASADPTSLNTASAPRPSHSATTSAAPTASKSTIADWTGDDDDINGFYTAEKRQRGGRKKRKKNNQQEERVMLDWDDVYDPSRPNIYDDYKHSEEKYREIREWKDRLYAHRFVKEKEYSDEMSEGSEDRPARNKAFAPPSAYSFAPPTTLNDDPVDLTGIDSASPVPPPARHAATVEDEDSEMPPRPSFAMPPPPPPPSVIAPAQQSPPAPPAGTISRAPVRYSLPEASTSLPSTDAELAAALRTNAAAEAAEDAANEAQDDRSEESPGPRSSAPGQKGFAERLMAKMGWTKGAGLGASESGMLAPLRVQMDKRKKKSDAEGGGFRGVQTAKIIGSKSGKGKKKEGEEDKEEVEEQGISEVVMLRGMVDGMDVRKEVENGLGQEIGEECGEKYGRVERVFIHQYVYGTASIPVFVKFTSQLSALRAVNALEGRVFNGNTISAVFYSTEKFEAGIYE